MENDFSTLYNTDTLDAADLNSFQTNSSENYEQVRDDLNDPITINECKRVISLAKSRKAVGIDCLPNEVFKNDNYVMLLCSFFNECLSNHCIPSMWSKSIINQYQKILKMAQGFR